MRKPSIVDWVDGRECTIPMTPHMRESLDNLDDESITVVSIDPRVVLSGDRELTDMIVDIVGEAMIRGKHE